MDRSPLGCQYLFMSRPFFQFEAFCIRWYELRGWFKFSHLYKYRQMSIFSAWRWSVAKRQLTMKTTDCVLLTEDILLKTEDVLQIVFIDYLYKFVSFCISIFYLISILLFSHNYGYYCTRIIFLGTVVWRSVVYLYFLQTNTCMHLHK